MTSIAATETGDSRIITLVVHLPPPSLRANSRAHWSRKKKDADDYSEAVFMVGRVETLKWARHAGSWEIRSNGTAPRNSFWRDPSLPWEKANVHYEWRYCGVEPDHGNLGGNTKALQDILCCAPRSGGGKDRWYLGIVDDDKGIHATYEAVKVAHRRDECVEITIEEVREHRGLDHKGVERECIQEIHFCIDDYGPPR